MIKNAQEPTYSSEIILSEIILSEIILSDFDLRVRFDLSHRFGGDIEVGGDGLDVIMIVECFNQFQDFATGINVEIVSGLTDEDEVVERPPREIA